MRCEYILGRVEDTVLLFIGVVIEVREDGLWISVVRSVPGSSRSTTIIYQLGVGRELMFIENHSSLIPIKNDEAINTVLNELGELLRNSLLIAEHCEE